MKVCINCHTENPLDAALCSECGMSLTRAPSKEEIEAGLGRTWKDRAQPELPLTASGLLYLFGEEFVKPGSGRFFGGQTLLVYSGHKVATNLLAHRLFLVALVSLADEGYISLREEKTLSLSIFPTEIYPTVATITWEKQGDDLPPSLEREIMSALSGDPEENRVPAVVAGVIQGDFFGPSLPPYLSVSGHQKVRRWWNWVVNCVMGGLAEAGWLEWEVQKRRFLPEKVQWSANESAIAPLAGEVITLKSTLEALRTANPRLYGLLADELRAAWGGPPE